jgi:hypothetical protein
MDMGSGPHSLLAKQPNSAAYSEASWNSSAFHAYAINGPINYVQRKWLETELHRIGFASYTRVNARVFGTHEDDCTRTQGASGGACRQGLTHAHYEVRPSATPSGHQAVTRKHEFEHACVRVG